MAFAWNFEAWCECVKCEPLSFFPLIRILAIPNKCVFCVWLALAFALFVCIWYDYSVIPTVVSNARGGAYCIDYDLGARSHHNRIWRWVLSKCEIERADVDAN